MTEPLRATAKMEPNGYSGDRDRGAGVHAEARQGMANYATVIGTASVSIPTESNTLARASAYTQGEKIVPRCQSMDRDVTAALIPDWAALLFACGVILAIAGFLAAWFLTSATPLLVMTIGLACSAAGMHVAERAIASAQTH